MKKTFQYLAIFLAFFVFVNNKCFAKEQKMIDVFQTSSKEFKNDLKKFLLTIYLSPYLTKDKYDIKINGFLKEKEDLENSLGRYLAVDLIEKEKKYKALIGLLHNKKTKKNIMTFVYFTNGELISPSFFWTGIDSEAMLIYQPKAKIDYFKNKNRVFIETKLPAEKGEIHQKWVFFNSERSCEMDVVYPIEMNKKGFYAERE